MTDGEAPFQPDLGQATALFRPRSAYAGYRAFTTSSGRDDDVLVEPVVARELRAAAESAAQERRVTGGLLFGRGWTDDQGVYLVVNGFLETRPGANSGDGRSPDSADDFTLSQADLRLLREDAARMHSASLELGWWRTVTGLGRFGPRDFMTQAALVGPDGVGLLVYGSGDRWGTAYLGPDGHAPNSAGTLVVTEPPPAPAPDPGAERGPGPEEPELVDISAGEHIRDDASADPLAPPDVLTRGASSNIKDVLTPAAFPPGTPVPRRARPRMQRGWRPPRGPSLAAPRPGAPNPDPKTPADLRLVLVALAVALIVVATIVGVLLHSVAVAVIIAVVCLLGLFFTAWMARQ